MPLGLIITTFASGVLSLLLILYLWLDSRKPSENFHGSMAIEGSGWAQFGLFCTLVTFAGCLIAMAQ